MTCVGSMRRCGAAVACRPRTRWQLGPGLWPPASDDPSLQIHPWGRCTPSCSSWGGTKRMQVGFFRQIGSGWGIRGHACGCRSRRPPLDTSARSFQRDLTCCAGLKLKTWQTSREGGKTGEVFVRSRDVDGRGTWTVEYFKLVALDGDGKYEALPANATNSGPGNTWAPTCRPSERLAVPPHLKNQYPHHDRADQPTRSANSPQVSA
ncbi:hypothetical protein Ddc_24106 [Ditylenchus destructor]|nr:hypothetical protein Ddc_24106 [Ditylenchus destructor]